MKMKAFAVGVLLLVVAIVLGAAWIINPGGIFNQYKNLSQVTVTISDPIFDNFENVWKGAYPDWERPQVVEGKMQILGHAVPHVYVWVTLQLHDVGCEWHTVFENRKFDLVRLAEQEENIIVNIEAENYDMLQITVHRMLITVETPAGTTITVEPAVSDLVVTITFDNFSLKVGGSHQLLVDFSASQSIKSIDITNKTADVSIKCVVGHREMGKSWVEIRGSS